MTDWMLFRWHWRDALSHHWLSGVMVLRLCLVSNYSFAATPLLQCKMTNGLGFMWDFLLYMPVCMHKSSASYLMTWVLFCIYWSFILSLFLPLLLSRFHSLSLPFSISLSVYVSLALCMCFASLICLLDGRKRTERT